MTRQSISKFAESFRHAILYLIREADTNGFEQVGHSLEEAERAIDRELDNRGISGKGARNRFEPSDSKLNRI